MVVVQGWMWLQLQPDSALTQWFYRRFAIGGIRMRRVGIVALARRLVIALWRYLKHGEIPAGAVLHRRDRLPARIRQRARRLMAHE